MSLIHAPSLVTTGLIYYHDMNNTKKSWFGQPTTNVIASDFDTTFESLSIGDTAGFNNQLGTGAYLGVSAEKSYVGSKSLKVNRGVRGATQGRIYRSYSVALGEYSAISCWVYSTVAGANLRIEYNGGDYAWTAPVTYNTHTGTGWELLWIRTTAPATSATTGYYFFYTNNDNVETYWDLVQVEKTQYPTPYVNGSRSSSSAIIDMINTVTVGINSLTYGSSNTFSFNGTTDYLSNATPNLVSGNGAFTKSAWIYSNFKGTSSRHPNIVSWGSNSTGTKNGLALMTDTSSNPLVLQWFYNNDYTWSIPDITSSWCNLCVTYISSVLTLYLNGVSLGTQTVTGTIAVANTELEIGRYTASNHWFSGQIPVLQIYNRALSAAEVQKNFNALRGRYEL